MEEKVKENKKIYYHLIVVVAFIAIFFLGIYIGYERQREVDKVVGVTNKDGGAIVSDADFASFWKAWNIINEKYPIPEKVSNQDKIWGAISGLAASLDDPYTVFFPPSEAKEFADTLSGGFYGVGMELGVKEKMIIVIAPLKDTPAYRGGIQPGDVLLKIDDRIVADMTLDEAVDLIRGEAGTTVTLTLLHEGESAPTEIQLVREKITIPTIDTELRSDGIFVISLYNFSANASDLFADAIKEFKASGSDKLLLDLRGNPGGYLDAAIDMASWFLPAGKPVVIEDFGEKQVEQIHRSKGYNAFGKNLDMVILIDGGSASASEILAGALSEHGVAILVGEKTYGKGSVQELIQVTRDSALKITIAKWLTPERVSISEKGIEPEIVVSITRDDIENEKDPQFTKAVEILKNKQ
ncbi:MAG: S41 family peptidase [Candidatus Pacebacteria bacterium]|nr:S41 family peptidase [Candidatus Paceibacterota bacterium]